MQAEPAPRARLAGVPLDAYSAGAVLDELRRRLATGERTRVNFVNAHCINIARRSKAYVHALERSQLVLADGSGVLTAARLRSLPIRQNLNGTDLLPKVMGTAAEAGATVFLLGARSGVAEEAARRLMLAHPGLEVVGTEHGYLGPDEEQRLLRRLRALKPDVLLVGMGVPIQELWIDRLWDELPVKLAFGAGAFLDFAAGRVPRAPRWLRVMGMEWSFRLAVEPRRMWRRYLLGNLQFLLYVSQPR